MHHPPKEATRGAGGGRRRSPARTAALLLVALLTMAGSGLLVSTLIMQPPRPPQPAADAAPPGFDPAGGQPQDPSDRDGEPVTLGESVPVRIKIPTIDVDAKIMQLGVDDDNQVEVPPLDKAENAGWYKHGATPGEIGPAVIIGHVDSRKTGPAVFFYLGDLEPGNKINVARKDGSVATFQVDGLKSYPKDQFPHDLIYGHTDTAQLRIVTCGGKLDKKRGNYLDNVIVFASLVSP